MSPARVLLTRFNLPSSGVESLIRAEEGWLRERVGLFERHTLPSVAAQSVPVQWLIYFDPASPGWLHERIADWQARLPGVLHPAYAEEVGAARLRGDVRALAAGHDEVLTANLDNDDGLARDFAARLESAAGPAAGRRAVYLARGLVLAGSDLYLRTDRANAFCAVCEPVDDAVTCWADWHNRLARQMPVVRSAGAPAWLQVVHGRNVSNRPRGRLVDPGPYADLFGPALAQAAPCPPGRRVRDALVERPRREARDAARTTARRAGVRLLGKDRFDRLKLALAR